MVYEDPHQDLWDRYIVESGHPDDMRFVKNLDWYDILFMDKIDYLNSALCSFDPPIDIVIIIFQRRLHIALDARIKINAYETVHYKLCNVTIRMLIYAQAPVGMYSVLANRILRENYYPGANNALRECMMKGARVMDCALESYLKRGDRWLSIIVTLIECGAFHKYRGTKDLYLIAPDLVLCVMFRNRVPLRRTTRLILFKRRLCNIIKWNT